MAILEISAVKNSGELRWGVRLIDDSDVPTLKSNTLMARAVALSAAKSLRSKGPDAPVLRETPESEPGTPVWILEKTNGSWSVRFSLVGETRFDLAVKPEDANSPEAFEQALKIAKSSLAKAEIKWNPPEADPAFEEKETDLTPTVGWPGS